MGNSKPPFKDWSPEQFSRISELLDESHEMSTPERETWLADLVGIDPTSAAILRDIFAAEGSPSGAFLEDRLIFGPRLTSTSEAECALIGKHATRRRQGKQTSQGSREPTPYGAGCPRP